MCRSTTAHFVCGRLPHCSRSNHCFLPCTSSWLLSITSRARPFVSLHPLHFDFFHFYSILALSLAHGRCTLYIPPLSTILPASFVVNCHLWHLFRYHESVSEGNSSILLGQLPAPRAKGVKLMFFYRLLLINGGLPVTLLMVKNLKLNDVQVNNVPLPPSLAVVQGILSTSIPNLESLILRVPSTSTVPSYPEHFISISYTCRWVIARRLRER